MNAEWIQAFLPYVVTLLTLIFLGYTLWHDRQPIDLTALPDQLEVAKSEAEEIATIVKAGVFAAEQLKSTGRLPDNNAAFDYAFTFAQKLLPNLDKATLMTFIESVVPLANQLYDATDSTKDHSI